MRPVPDSSDDPARSRNENAGSETPARKVIPKKCDVVIIGGGPAGSTAATLLAREGFHAVLLEKEKFPRPQVGESTIPHLWQYTDLLGVTERLREEGFVAKSGAITAWHGMINQLKFSDFGYSDPQRPGMHVERDIFDDILLRHTKNSGAQVFELVAVRSVDLTLKTRPITTYVDRREGTFAQGQIESRYVIDASGHAALIARQLNTRKLVSEKIQYLGLWGYYKNALFLGEDRSVYSPDRNKEIRPVTFIASFKDGWIWHIALRETTSVRLVINRADIKGMGKGVQEEYLRETCAQTPILQDLLQPATFIEGSMNFRPDYSSYSEKVVGENYFCIGDAGAFVDPVFSQGVVAAFFNAAICAGAIALSFRNDKRRDLYGRIAERKMLQYYGFSRLLALGDFGGEGVDLDLVGEMMRSFPKNELELALAAAFTTSRSDNLHQMAHDAGIHDQYGASFGNDKLTWMAVNDLRLPTVKSGPDSKFRK